MKQKRRNKTEIGQKKVGNLHFGYKVHTNKQRLWADRNILNNDFIIAWFSGKSIIKN
jgi:hypothetical protein